MENFIAFNAFLVNFTGLNATKLKALRGWAQRVAVKREKGVVKWPI